MANEPQIVFQGNDFLVLDKPYGLTVNKSDTADNQSTLQDWLEKKFKIQGEGDFYKRAGIVHRLDKDTSGLILIAKNPISFAKLQSQFKERLVKKTYLALVWGVLKEGGQVNAPITRNPYNRMRFGVFIGGKEAHTKYSVLKNLNIDGADFTLLEVTPTTGRTHQIRVHLNYIGHPVAGDPLYSGRKMAKEGLRKFGRLMLHAYRLSFLDPKDNKRIEFNSEIPKEFKSFYK